MPVGTEAQSRARPAPEATEMERVPPPPATWPAARVRTRTRTQHLMEQLEQLMQPEEDQEQAWTDITHTWSTRVILVSFLLGVFGVLSMAQNVIRVDIVLSTDPYGTDLLLYDIFQDLFHLIIGRFPTPPV